MYKFYEEVKFFHMCDQKLTWTIHDHYFNIIDFVISLSNFNIFLFEQ